MQDKYPSMISLIIMTDLRFINTTNDLKQKRKKEQSQFTSKVTAEGMILSAVIIFIYEMTIFHSPMVRVALSKFTPIFTIRRPSDW